MKNPFVFGVPVEGQSFADREQEKKEILDAFFSGSNLILFAPRRHGKSSLLKEVCSSLSEEYITVWLDISEVSTLRGLLERMLKAVHYASKMGKITGFVKHTLPKFLSMFKISLGDVDISITTPEEKDLEALCLEIFDLPEKVGSRLNKKVRVIFDEFQDILLLGKGIDRKMRARIQHHKFASYVFMGSRHSLINSIFFDKKSPFYYIGKKIEINYIPKDEFKSFIKDRFAATGKKIEGSQIDIILEATSGHPYFTQLLCFEIWNSAIKKVTSKDVEESLKRCLSSSGYIYEMLLDQIRNRTQRALLAHLAKSGSKNLFSFEALRQMEIKNPNALSYATKRLLEMEIIEKDKKGEYRFVDPFFALYLKQRMQ